jgi:predicted DNA-binding transcriptional regulator YafY
MNRIDRLFGILLLLQKRSLVRAEDLANVFTVTRRTIYRDMAALNDMGVPVVALPGEGYQLMEGFYLPPLSFTPAEASALILGARMLALQAAGQTTEDARQAVAKIMHILPRPTQEQVERLSEIIQFFVPRERFNLDDPGLVNLQRAILERHPIFIRYHSYSRDEITAREVEPHGLTYSAGSWYVSGYCRLRQAVRGFRLDRVEELKILSGTFSLRPASEETAEMKVAQVRFASTVVRWVRERQHYAFQSEDVDPHSGDSVMAYHVHQLAEMKPWLLSWGASAEVLTPDVLRQEIRQEALKLADMLT